MAKRLKKQKVCSARYKKTLKDWISPLSFRDFFRLAASYLRFDTIFGVQWLDFCVRDGNRYDPLAIATILQRIAFTMLRTGYFS